MMATPSRPSCAFLTSFIYGWLAEVKGSPGQGNSGTELLSEQKPMTVPTTSYTHRRKEKEKEGEGEEEEGEDDDDDDQEDSDFF